MNLRKRWRTIFGVFVLSILCFTSCDNFLQGDDVKKDITDAIEYNNAKSYIIKFKADKESGVIKTPAGEEISKKVTDTFTIKFDPEDDHKFLKWEAIISGADKDESASAYISFEDATSLETKVTFKKAADSIIIRPVCPERLSVTKFNMSNEAEEYPRDSSIILTFNRKIPEACSDAFSISIPGLEEDKAWTDYFLPAEINGKEVTFRTKYTQTHSEADLIPVLQNASKAITISLNAKKLWYVNNEYSQDININLDKDISYKYIVNSATSKKTTIKLTSENEQCSLRVNDIVWNGQSISSNVGDSIALRCKPMEGWCFCGWKFTRTYIENDQQKTEQIPASSLADINLKLEYEEGSNQYGFDAETKIAQAKLIVNNYIEGTITVSPVMYESLSVTFNMADAEKLYPRNNSIELTFNHPVMEECLDKITVRIPGLPQGASASDYFEPAEINGNKIILKAKTGEGRAADMIPVAANGSLGITVIVPAGEVYYQAQTQDETYKVGLYSEKVFTYTVNTETVNKTQIKLHVDPEFRDKGSLRIGEEDYSEKVTGYSVGKGFSLSYTISEDFSFFGWKVTHTNGQNTVNEFIIPDEAEKLESVNLSVVYKDEKIAEPTFTIEKYIDGEIQIQPFVSKIPDVDITLDGQHGTFTPGKGTLKYKYGVKNHIEFDAASDYEFLRWQVVNGKTNKEIQLTTPDANNPSVNKVFIRFDSASSEKTNFQLVQIPNESDNITLVIRPVLVERPRVISSSPSYQSSGVLRDTTIQVMFDYDMSEKSIYYTEDEIESLYNSGIPYSDFLPAIDENDLENSLAQKHYGYKQDGKIFFKNILITNSRNDENINNCFKAPVFENTRTLAIPVDRRSPIAPGVRVAVSLSEGFFYTINNKDINMSRAEKWQYLVNGGTDINPPEIASGDLIVQDSKGNVLTALLEQPDINLSELKYFGGGKFKLYLKATDITATDSTFNIVYEKLFEADYTTPGPHEQKTLMVEYTNPSGQTSEYKEIDYLGNEKRVEECELKGLDDGIYSLYFEVKDTSGNKRPYPATTTITEQNITYNISKYYFCLDKTAPAIEEPEITDGDSNSSINISWDWDETLVPDYEKAMIKYRKWGATEAAYTDVPVPKAAGTTKTLNLDPGTHYEIITQFFDYAGNKTEYIAKDGVYTRPGTPAVTLTYTETSASLTCTKPDEGNFTDFRMILKKSPSGQEPIAFSTENGIATANIEGLEKGTKYEFEICSYDEESEKYSLPYYETGTTIPSYTTRPNAPKNVVADFTGKTNEGTVVWTKPENGITEYIIYCSTDPAIPENDTTKTTKKTSTLTTTTFSTLSPGTTYYVKVLSYFGTPDNTAETEVYTSNTKCAPVTNLSYTAASNTALAVSWTAPAGNFDSYTVSYKLHSATAWSTQNVNKVNNSTQIDGLTGATDYDIKVLVNGLTKSTEVSLDSCKTCPNPATNLYAKKSSDTSFIANWTKPSGSFDGYTLYYSQNENFSSAQSVSISSTSTSKEIYGLESKKLYYIKLETYIGTTLKTQTTPIACSLAFDNVTNLTATPVSRNSIKLTWINPEGTFDGIKIYKNTETAPCKTLSNTTTEYTVPDLSANTTYTFNVEVYKNDGGNVLSAKAPVSSCTYSSPMQSCTATATGPTSVNISYVRPVNDNEWSKLYIYKNGSYLDWWSPSYEDSHNYTGYEGGTSYTFTIKTLNRNGVPNPIDADIVSSTVTTPPKPVTNLNCKSTTSSSATLSWTKPSGNYTGVKIYYKLHSASTWPAGQVVSASGSTTTEKSVTLPTAGTSYDFKVETYLTGVDNIGETSVTYLNNIFIKPAAPTNFYVSSRTATSMTFKWTAPSGNYDGYRLKYKKSSDPDSESYYTYKTPLKNETTYKLTGLQQGTTYNIYLLSYSSETSNYSSASLTKITNPGVPTGLTIQGVDGGTKVSWSAPANGATKYYVEYSKNNSSWSSVNTTSTSYTFSNTSLDNSTKYYYRVKAYNTANSEGLYSSYTSTLQFYTPPASATISPSIYCDDARGTIVLRWIAPSDRSDINGFNVYVYGNSTLLGTTETYTAGSYVTAAVTIPSYSAGSSYYFNFEPYHTLNSTKTVGPKTKTSSSLTPSSGAIRVNGTAVSYSQMRDVLTSSKTIYDRPTDGGSFVRNDSINYVRTVTLSKYSIGTYEVTNALWRAVTGDTSTYNNSYPKTNISWQQAIAFCNKLSAIQGLEPCYEISGITDWKNFNMSDVPTSSDSRWYGCKQNLKKNGYHLPTCAQWEFAARGGDPSKTEFFYGVSGVYDWAVMPQYVVYGTTSASTVGSKYPNRLGLYDMIGNVWEMLTDWYNAWPGGYLTDPYCEVQPRTSVETVQGVGQAIPYINPITLYRAGGCYVDNENLTTPYNGNLRVYATYANYFYAPDHDVYTGFRLCRNVTN